MKLIVAGSRNITDQEEVFKIFDQFIWNKHKLIIVSGCAKGIDNLAIEYAKKYQYELVTFPADWNRYGKSAGYKRNIQMAEYADALLAIWDGESKGTKHMIDIMLQYKKLTIVIPWQKTSCFF